MKKYCAALLASAAALTVQAGPNWQAIETARQEKQENRVQTEVQHTQHATAMQKLKAACDKAQSNVEVAEACREMMAACAEMM